MVSSWTIPLNFFLDLTPTWSLTLKHYLKIHFAENLHVIFTIYARSPSSSPFHYLTFNSPSYHEESYPRYCGLPKFKKCHLDPRHQSTLAKSSWSTAEKQKLVHPSLLGSHLIAKPHAFHNLLNQNPHQITKLIIYCCFSFDHKTNAYHNLLNQNCYFHQIAELIIYRWFSIDRRTTCLSQSPK